MLKQNDAYPYEYVNRFQRCSEKKLPEKKHFLRSLKDEKTHDKGEKLDVHVTDEGYLTCIKIWNRFNLKNTADYHDHYLKKDGLLLAEVFEKFTSESLKFYKLYPFQFSWIKLGCNFKNDWNKIKTNSRHVQPFIY